jgi:hypothetical protein
MYDVESKLAKYKKHTKKAGYLFTMSLHALFVLFNFLFPLFAEQR